MIAERVTLPAVRGCVKCGKDRAAECQISWLFLPVWTWERVFPSVPSAGGLLCPPCVTKAYRAAHGKGCPVIVWAKCIEPIPVAQLKSWEEG